MCIGAWSMLGYVKDRVIRATTKVSEVVGDELKLEKDWDMITIE
jgi:hypothetical protein